MQAQFLPILLLTIPLALCVISILGRNAREPELATIRSVARARLRSASIFPITRRRYLVQLSMRPSRRTPPIRVRKRQLVASRGPR